MVVEMVKMTMNLNIPSRPSTKRKVKKRKTEESLTLWFSSRVLPSVGSSAFVAPNNNTETMEDLLYRVRRLALGQMGTAFPDELILRVANKTQDGTAAGAAEAEVKGVPPAESGLDIILFYHQAVRTKLYYRRPTVTPFVRGDPWTDGCVAIGWMTDGLKFVCLSERLGFQMKYLKCQWTGYTLFFPRRARLAKDPNRRWSMQAFLHRS